MSLVNNVLLGWLLRRAGELGGWIGGLATVYLNMPQEGRDLINNAIAGNWGVISIAGVIGLVSYVYSYLATMKPAVVTDDGTKVSLESLAPSTKTIVETSAHTAATAKKPTLLDRLLGRG